MAKDGGQRQTHRMQIGNWDRGRFRLSGEIITAARSSHNAIKNFRLLFGFNRKHLGKSKPALSKPEEAATSLGLRTTDEIF
jgi:hypothetical protein